eukprot:2116540-Amphidinium_carterae.2
MLKSFRSIVIRNSRGLLHVAASNEELSTVGMAAVVLGLTNGVVTFHRCDTSCLSKSRMMCLCRFRGKLVLTWSSVFKQFLLHTILCSLLTLMVPYRLGSSIQLRLDGGTHRLGDLFPSARVRTS